MVAACDGSKYRVLNMQVLPHHLLKVLNNVQIPVVVHHIADNLEALAVQHNGKGMTGGMPIL